MGNRKLPFGYRMEEGRAAIHPQESELVKAIFQKYLANESIKQIAARLDLQPIRYDGQKSWNKNMVTRIIADSRYVGEKSFPAIIEPDTLSAAINLKASKQRGSQPTAAQKALRRLCGQKTSAKTENAVLELLNSLAGHPEQIGPQIIDESRDRSSCRRELDEVMRQFPIDEKRAKKLAFSTAASQYLSIGSSTYETMRMRRLVAAAEAKTELDADLLRSLAASIQINADGQVTLTLKNGQRIGVGSE